MLPTRETDLSYPPETQRGKGVISLYLLHKAALLELDNKRLLTAGLFCAMPVSADAHSAFSFSFCLLGLAAVDNPTRCNVPEPNAELWAGFASAVWLEDGERVFCLTPSTKRGTCLCLLSHGSAACQPFTGQAPTKKRLTNPFGVIN